MAEPALWAFQKGYEERQKDATSQADRCRSEHIYGPMDANINPSNRQKQSETERHRAKEATPPDNYAAHGKCHSSVIAGEGVVR